MDTQLAIVLEQILQELTKVNYNLASIQDDLHSMQGSGRYDSLSEIGKRIAELDNNLTKSGMYSLRDVCNKM